MKSLTPLLAFSLAGASLLSTGCQSRQESPSYSAVRVSNYRGETLAEYVARGAVRSGDDGLNIHAVERRTFDPYPQYQRYPLGWETTVIGPRIHHWPIGKPAWLDEEALDSSSGYSK